MSTNIYILIIIYLFIIFKYYVCYIYMHDPFPDCVLAETKVKSDKLYHLPFFCLYTLFDK